MKIAVYTIALNEAAHVERWANSAVDADYRVVADTVSTDDTAERLTKAFELDPNNQRLKNNLDFFVRRREEVREGG